jgi:hypothetical protein
VHCLERFDHFHKVRHFPKAISHYPRRLLSFSPIAPDVLPVHHVKDYPRIALDQREQDKCRAGWLSRSA